MSIQYCAYLVWMWQHSRTEYDISRVHAEVACGLPSFLHPCTRVARANPPLIFAIDLALLVLPLPIRGYSEFLIGITCVKKLKLV